MEKTILLGLLLGAMVLVSMFQAIQIMGLSEILSGSNGIAGTSSSSGTTPTPIAGSPSTTSASSSGSSLDNLPAMVGGC